jgi:hypothetical protein
VPTSLSNRKTKPQNRETSTDRIEAALNCPARRTGKDRPAELVGPLGAALAPVRVVQHAPQKQLTGTDKVEAALNTLLAEPAKTDQPN